MLEFVFCWFHQFGQCNKNCDRGCDGYWNKNLEYHKGWEFIGDIHGFVLKKISWCSWDESVCQRKKNWRQGGIFQLLFFLLSTLPVNVPPFTIWLMFDRTRVLWERVSVVALATNWPVADGRVRIPLLDIPTNHMKINIKYDQYPLGPPGNFCGNRKFRKLIKKILLSIIQQFKCKIFHDCLLRLGACLKKISVENFHTTPKTAAYLTPQSK